VKFRSGGIVIGSAQDAGNLQDAIWYLEGEIGSLAFNGADGTSFTIVLRSCMPGRGISRMPKLWRIRAANTA
jgi:hypothetical protein